jgi:DNA-binding NarL/FixJ family response regulator
VREAIRFFLEIRTPYKVCGEVGYGFAAIEKAREASCDLILLNLSIPMLTGVEIALALRGILPQAKIVGFSMASVEFDPQMVGAGFDVILSKDEGLAKLAETVRALMPPPADGPRSSG